MGSSKTEKVRPATFSFFCHNFIRLGIRSLEQMQHFRLERNFRAGWAVYKFTYNFLTKGSLCLYLSSLVCGTHWLIMTHFIYEELKLFWKAWISQQVFSNNEPKSAVMKASPAWYCFKLLEESNSTLVLLSTWGWTPGTVVHQAPLSMEFPGKNTGVDSQSLLQGIFSTPGLDLDLLHCRPIVYHLNHQGRPLSLST